MTNRPQGQRAVKWRKPVNLGSSYPSSLHFRADWLTAEPLDGTEDTVSLSAHFKWNHVANVDDNTKECNARFIITAPSMQYNDGNGMYIMKPDYFDYIKEQLLEARTDCMEGRIGNFPRSARGRKKARQVKKKFKLISSLFPMK